MEESGHPEKVTGSPIIRSPGEDFAEYLGFDTRFESDRVTAIVSMALLESEIQNSIYCAFGMDDKHAARLIGNDDTAGELGFSDQCRLAYCLKILGPVTLGDLLVLAKIRNKFAHREDTNSFSRGKVRDFCSSLKSPEFLKDVPDRFAYGKSPPPNIAADLASRFDLKIPKNRFLFCCWMFLHALPTEAERIINAPGTSPTLLH